VAAIRLVRGHFRAGRGEFRQSRQQSRGERLVDHRTTEIGERLVPRESLGQWSRRPDPADP
jgi:hypothetical protein